MTWVYLCIKVWEVLSESFFDILPMQPNKYFLLQALSESRSIVVHKYLPSTVRICRVRYEPLTIPFSFILLEMEVLFLHLASLCFEFQYLYPWHIRS